MHTPKIAVIGSINMDLVTTAPRFPAVGETLLGSGFAQFMGGKGANQAVAAARLGAEVALVGAVGDDAFGRELLAGLQAQGVDTAAVKTLADTPTGMANITVAEADNHIIVVSGANFGLTVADIAAQEALIAAADVVLSQLEIPLPCVEAAAALAQKHGKPFILNPAPAQRLPENLLQGFQAAFFIAKPVFLKIRTAQRAGFGLAVLPGDAIKGDAHYLVAVFFVAGKAVDGELQGV